MPVPGLKAYDVDDADKFFGRDADVAACLRKLADTSVLAVVGPSGCGKSSLIRGRRRGRVAAATGSGGGHDSGCTPSRSAGRGNAPRGPSPALLVDQCEEVFSLCQDTVERDAFLTALTAHLTVAPLVLSFRADRLADISSHPAFARAVEQGLHCSPRWRATYGPRSRNPPGSPR